MKRIKRCWRIFVLCFIFSFTAAVFISCGPDFDADAKEDQPTAGNSATTTPPTETEKPTDPTNPDLPSHEHHYSDWEIDTAATCTKPQIEKRTCAECGESETRAVGEPLEHKYNPKEQPATCTAAGYIKYTCCYCGDSYTNTISATGHNYTATIIEPTCTQDGYTLSECTHCHDTRKENPTSATGHNYEIHGHSKTCTKCNASEMIAPIENLACSYWFLTGKTWAIYFIDENNYCTFRYTLENGDFKKGTEFKYKGTYQVIEFTDPGTGSTNYSIKFEDAYCKAEIANGNSELYPYPKFTLKYYADKDETTSEMIYTLQGENVTSISGNCTLIFAGYDL